MELTIREIQNLLPHRYPFLLVDKVLEHDENSIVGIKNVSVNEPFFQGHFPGIPIMPGVLIIEAMAQVSGLLYLAQHSGDGQKRITYFAGIDNAKFRKPVVPGDQLRFEITVSRIRKHSLKTHGIAKVDDHVVAEADLFLMTETIEEDA